MAFPESPREIFRHNPIEAVICQLRFPAVLSIAAEAPARFQDAIREQYPLYERQNEVDVSKELGGLMAGVAIPLPSGSVNHVFYTADRSRFVSMGVDFVAVTDLAYTRWEQFRAEIIRAKEALERTYAPAFYARTGLRYRDVVSRSELGLEDQPWESLLHPAVTGLLSAGEGISETVQGTRTETLLSIDPAREALVRVQHGLGQQEEETVYLFDCDYHTAQRSELDEVVDTLDFFNRQAGYFFRWAIRDRLRDALGPSDLDGD